MLTSTYWWHRPDSSRLAKLGGRNPVGQPEGLEHARIREDDVAGDLPAEDREDLKAVQAMPVARIRRVRGKRALSVGAEWPYAPARTAHLEDAVHEQPVVAAAAIPQRHRRHLQYSVVGEEPNEVRNVCCLERLHVSVDDRPRLRIVRLGHILRVSYAGHGGPSPLQGTVDGCDRDRELRRDLGGAEFQYFAQHEHSTLPRWQDLHGGD